MSRIYSPEFLSEGPNSSLFCHDEFDCMLGERATEQLHDFEPWELREKPSTVSAQAESGFTPEGAIGKTVGLSYGTEANL